jgi:hypothetical protein
MAPRNQHARHLRRDLANPLMPPVTTASWQGAMAGIFAQQSMLV